MTILIGVLLVLLALVLLLAIPVWLSFDVSWPRDAPQDVRLAWAFGLLRVRVPVSGRVQTSEETKKPKRRKRSKKKPKRKRNVLAAIRHDAFRTRCVRFIRDLWNAMHTEQLRIKARAGLGDPADTGQLWAVLGPVSGMLTSIERAAISIEPDFGDATFEVDGAGRLRVIPLQLLYLAIALMLSPPVWQGLRQLRGAG